MEFSPMTPDEIGTYLDVLGDTAEAVSVILTDATMLTGQYVITDDPSLPLILGAIEDPIGHFVPIPAGRIAGILEQNLVGTPEPDRALLVTPALQAGLELVSVPFTFFHLRLEDDWIQGSSIRFEERSMLYFDARGISARSGGINNVGIGFIGSGQIGWENTLVGKAERRLKRHVVEIGSHCTAPRADLTVIGYVEFFDVSGLQPSSDGGPLIELEGSRWTAAAVYNAPPGSRHLDNRWALCYFRQDGMSLEPRSWKRMTQPVRVYGDKQPSPKSPPSLGVAQCRLLARAAACFPTDT
jgi:hypothetical protein